MSRDLIIGGTRAGKSAHIVQYVRDFYADQGIDTRPACVWIDPQWGKSGFDFYQSCLALGLDAIFESLGDTDSVIRWNELIRSKLKGLDGENADKRTIEMFLDALIRSREERVAEHVLIKQWGENWSRLMLHQKHRLPLADGIWAFRPKTPSFNKLLANCTDKETAHRFKYLPLHPATLERIVAPAERLLDPVFNSPAVKARDGMGQGFDFDAALDDRKIMIFEGGDLSEEEIGFLLRRIVLRVIDYKRRGGKTPVILVIEEAEAYRMIGEMETKALKTLAFYGLHMMIICQVPYFLNDEITLDVFQNTSVHKWFRCPSWEVAAIAARDCQARIDPWMVHSIVERERERTTGYEAITTETSSYREGGTSTQYRPSTSSISRQYGSMDYSLTNSGPGIIVTKQDPSTTYSTSTRDRAIRESYTEETKRYFSLSDQERLLGIAAMHFATGTFAMKTQEGVELIKTEKPEDLWVWPGLGEIKAKKHLAEIKKRAPFSRIGVNGNGSPNRGSKSTQARSGKSKKLQDSPAIRPAKKTSGNGQRKAK